MMDDILKKLTQIEASAPKAPAKKKKLTEDTSKRELAKKPTLKDVFNKLSESIPAGATPLPVMDPTNKKTGMGFVTSTNPSVQNILKNLDPKDVQIVQAPGQPGQAPAPSATIKPTGTVGATQGGQGQAMGAGQQAVQEKDEGKPGKNFAKIAKSAGERYGSKAAGERVAGAVRAKLAKQGKLEEEQLGEISKGKAMQALQDVSSDPDDGRSYSLQQKIGKKWPEMKGHAADAAYTSVYGRTDRDSFQDPDKLAARAKTSYRMNKGGTANKQDLKARFRREVDEGAKVDRMVKHIEKSERGLGKSKDKASDIAWATANKRGMLDNKNKKVKEADIPSSAGIDNKGAGLGAGRSPTTLEGKEPQVEVIDNAFNRENYKELIGKKYAKSKAPSYARVKEVTEGKKGVNPFAKKDDKASTKAPAKGKKPDFLDLDKDGNKKEPMKKAAADKKKQKVKESMNHRISAARLEGKSHGLRGHAHSGKRYEDLDEMRAYHDGYKDGLDECYGQGVYETATVVGGMGGGRFEPVAAKVSAPATPAATVPGMASQAMPTMEDDMEEGNAFTGALARTPKGGKFSVGGKTFTDRSSIDEYAFESWNNQLKALVNESEVNEGLSVSISKGQQNSPDSVTITAQDAEAEHLLAFVKNAGLGLFGDDNADTHSSAMSIQPVDGGELEANIDVVDGSDGMLSLMKKLGGISDSGHGDEDYADEEGDEEHLYGNHETADKKDCGCAGDCECSDYDQPSNEASCNECGTYEGMHEAGCSMGTGKEMVDEVESEDQMEFEVAEANAPDTGADNTNADVAGQVGADKALATADAGQDVEDGMSDQAVQESDDEEDFFHNPRVSRDKQLPRPPKEINVKESFMNLYKKLAFLSEESTESEDEKAEKAGKKVAKDIEYDEDHKGKDDDKAEKAGKKVTKDIEYDDKKDKKEKVDEWANNAGPGKTVSDTTFEQDIDFMTKVIAGGLNKPKSTGQTTIPVIAGQDTRTHDNPKDWATLAGIKKS
jgi:hypothetical protein